MLKNKTLGDTEIVHCSHNLISPKFYLIPFILLKKDSILSHPLTKSRLCSGDSSLC